MSSAPAPGAREPDDRALLAALQSGEPSAFERLVRTHGGRMLAVARRILKSEEDAQDALQDGFLSAYRAIAEFKGDAKLSTWLHRIVVNAALMKLRARRRRPESSIEDLLPHYRENGHPETPASDWREAGDLERAELRELVRAKIDALPESYRTVLMLRDIEELDTRETAQMLEISPNAVKIRLHRARQALQELLHPHLGKDA